jgi:hypothetical protein
LSAVDETIECIGVIKHFRKGEMTKPTPHGPKLKELSSNSKLPAEDHKAVASAISAYEKWISDMTSLKSNGEEKVKDLVDGLWYKEFWGSASSSQSGKTNRIEGIKKLVPFKDHSIFTKLTQIEESLQSAISYAGGNPANLDSLTVVEYCVKLN